MQKPDPSLILCRGKFSLPERRAPKEFPLPPSDYIKSRLIVRRAFNERTPIY